MSCPAIGVAGVHSDAYYDGRRCNWCAACPCTDIVEAHCDVCGAETTSGAKIVVAKITD